MYQVKDKQFLYLSNSFITNGIDLVQNKINNTNIK